MHLKCLESKQNQKQNSQHTENWGCDRSVLAIPFSLNGEGGADVGAKEAGTTTGGGRYNLGQNSPLPIKLLPAQAATLSPRPQSPN